MDRAPEEQHLVALMLGHQVAIEYLAGVSVDSESMERVREGEVLRGQPEARTRAVYLQGYSQFGIEVSANPEGGDETFIPWSAVMALYGHSRQQLVQDAREDMEREQAVGGETTGDEGNREYFRNLIKETSERSAEGFKR